jgi:hypothetical protein
MSKSVQKRLQAQRADQPDVTCKGFTFLPVPVFDDVTVAFGPQESAYFNRHDLPKVPRQYEAIVDRLFASGGEWPAFGDDVNKTNAKRAIKAWLCSFAPAHESKIATVAYALWVWSPESAEARTKAKGES